MNAAFQPVAQPANDSALLPTETPTPQPQGKSLPAAEPVALAQPAAQPFARLTLAERVARRRPHFRKVLLRALSQQAA